MFSKAVKYAIRAVTYITLYESDNVVNSKYLSQKLDIPEPFLAKILQKLKKNNILKSFRGIKGGFSLNINPFNIYFIDIINIFDGSDVFYDCLLGMKICTKSKANRDKCPFKVKIDPIQQNLLKIFSTVSIGEFCSDLSKYSDTISI